MNLNVNFNTPTIEKVIQKRWTIVEEIMTNVQDGMRAQLAEAEGDTERSSIRSAMETVGSIAKQPADKFNEDSFFAQVVQDAMAIKAAVDDPCTDVARWNAIACIFKKYDFGITTFLRALFIPVVQKNDGRVLKYAAEEQQSGVSPPPFNRLIQRLILLTHWPPLHNRLINRLILH